MNSNTYIKLSYTDTLLVVALNFGVSIILSIIMTILFEFLHIEVYSFLEGISINISIIISYLLTFILLHYLLFKPREQKQRFNFSTKDIMLLPIILFLYIGQLLLSEFLTSLIPTTGEFWGNLYNTMTNALVGNIKTYPILTFFTVCIVAPIFEEIFFRGYILKGLLNNSINPYLAILISALIFGGIHIFPWQVVGGTLAGLVLGLVFYKTQSLLFCMILHFLNNLFSLLLFLKYESFDASTFGNSYTTLICGIALILVFGFLYLKLTKNNTWKYY